MHPIFQCSVGSQSEISCCGMGIVPLGEKMVKTGATEGRWLIEYPYANLAEGEVFCPFHKITSPPECFLAGSVNLCFKIAV